MDAGVIRQRIADTTLWCESHATTADPRNSLRSSALQPRHYGASREWQRYRWDDSPANRAVIVNALADLRASLADNDASVIDQGSRGMAGGRLVVYFPDDNLYDGAAAVLSQGYFDVDNAPPWDTWIAYLPGRQSSPAGDFTPLADQGDAEGISFLLAWVPSQFIQLANTGIWANPEKCISWAEESSATVVGYLTDLGLMRPHSQTGK
jgi:hypothetical protein